MRCTYGGVLKIYPGVVVNRAVLTEGGGSSSWNNRFNRFAVHVLLLEGVFLKQPFQVLGSVRLIYGQLFFSVVVILLE